MIHTAFIHDFSNYAAAARRKARHRGLGAALAGSERPAGRHFRDRCSCDAKAARNRRRAANSNFPRKSEAGGAGLASRGVRVSVVRLPPSVHGDGDHGFVPRLIAIAREKGVSAYVGDGHNRWPAVHRLDAAHLLQAGAREGCRGGPYHGVADEGVPFRDIAGVIGRRLNVPVVSKSPEEAADILAGSPFRRRRLPASSQRRGNAWDGSRNNLR